MDNELFELCKEVYEATGWKTLTEHPDQNFALDGHFNYTTDYLMEKLPASIDSKEYPGKYAKLWTRKNDNLEDNPPSDKINYFAWYFVNGEIDGVSDYGVHADTLLKALLKLTLALKKAGEL